VLMLGMLNNKSITIPAHYREGRVQGRHKRCRPGRAAETKDAEAGSSKRVLLSKEYKLPKVSNLVTASMCSSHMPPPHLRRHLIAWKLWIRTTTSSRLQVRYRGGLGNIRGGLGNIQGGLGNIRWGLGNIRWGLGNIRGGLGNIRGRLGNILGFLQMNMLMCIVLPV
jgi:hypothetical protein